MVYLYLRLYNVYNNKTWQGYENPYKSTAKPFHSPTTIITCLINIDTTCTIIHIYHN